MNVSVSLKRLVGEYSTVVPARSMYCSSFLGLQRYWRRREQTRLTDHQRHHLYDHLQSSLSRPDGHIHTELLACYLHVADDSTDDQHLVERSIERYSAREPLYRFWHSGIGPTAIRYYYHHKLFDQAKLMLLRSDLGDFFHQTISYMLVMNALYTEQRLSDVLHVCDRLRQVSSCTSSDVCDDDDDEEDTESQLTPFCVSPSAQLLAFAAAYKLSNECSVDWMYEQYTQTVNSDHPTVYRRTAALYTQALINVGRYKQALNVLDQRSDTEFGVFRDIKVKLLCKMDNVGEAVNLLKTSFEKCSIPGSPHYKYRCVRDAISELKSAVQARADPEITSEFDRLHKAIVSYDYISSAYLDDILCAPLMGRDTNPEFRPAKFNMTSSNTSASTGHISAAQIDNFSLHSHSSHHRKKSFSLASNL